MWSFVKLAWLSFSRHVILSCFFHVSLKNEDCVYLVFLRLQWNLILSIQGYGYLVFLRFQRNLTLSRLCHLIFLRFQRYLIFSRLCQPHFSEVREKPQFIKVKRHSLTLQKWGIGLPHVFEVLMNLEKMRLFGTSLFWVRPDCTGW